MKAMDLQVCIQESVESSHALDMSDHCFPSKDSTILYQPLTKVVTIKDFREIVFKRTARILPKNVL